MPDVHQTSPAPLNVDRVARITGRDGRRFTLGDPQAVIAASMARGVDLAIDYEHQSAGPAHRANGPVPAAGWIKGLELRPDGIWGRVDWTAQARELIASRAYRYLSPTFLHRPDGTVLRLTGAGLVHQPNLELTALSHEEPAMPDRSPAFAARLAAALGLPEGTEGSAIEDRFFALVEQMATLVAKDGASATNAAHPDPAEYAPLAAMRELPSERNTALAALSEQEAERRVGAALAQGYITPGMHSWAPALYPLIAAEVGIAAPTAWEVAQVYVDMAAILRALAAPLETVRLGAVAAMETADTVGRIGVAWQSFLTHMNSASGA